MGGDWRPAGRGQEAGGTEGRNKVEEPRSGLQPAGPRPEGSAAHSRDRREAMKTPPREARRPHQPPGHAPMTMIRTRGSQRANAPSARPPAVRRACADVLSRRTAKKAAPSAQRGQTDARPLPPPAGGSARSSDAALPFRGRRGGVQPPRKGYGETPTCRGWPSGEGFPLKIILSLSLAIAGLAPK